MVVVSNSTPLISLSAIGLLSLLNTLYGDVLIPAAVYQEVVTDGAGRAGAREVAEAARVQPVNITNKVEAHTLCIIEDIDVGESEAIILAQELAAGLILLDDGAARRVATVKGLRRTGEAIT